MNQFQLSPGGTPNPSLPRYGKLDNLQAIHERNVERFKTFYAMGNRVLPNQHPLVQFLLQLSININWTPAELYNYIELQSKKIASNVGITSLYNRGKDHAESVYPESNHRTLIVMPFEKPEFNQDNVTETLSLGRVCLKPIMTTSKTHYWNLDHLIDTVQRVGEEQTFTVLELDVYQFVFGYYWYLKERIENNVNVGLTPHHYVLLCLLDTYVWHNALVNLNLIAEGDDVTVQRSGFALEQYNFQQNEYNSWIRKQLLGERIKSPNEWLKLSVSSFRSLNLSDMVFSHRQQSMMFVQLGWVYTLASLHWAKGYLYFMDFMGSYDPITTSKLKTFYKIPVNYNSNQIKDPYWARFYINVWKDLKDHV